MFLDKKGFCSPESGSVVVLQGTQEITVVFKDFCSGCTTIVVTVKTISGSEKKIIFDPKTLLRVY